MIGKVFHQHRVPPKPMELESPERLQIDAVASTANMRRDLSAEVIPVIVSSKLEKNALEPRFSSQWLSNWCRNPVRSDFLRSGRQMEREPLNPWTLAALAGSQPRRGCGFSITGNARRRPQDVDSSRLTPTGTSPAKVTRLTRRN